MLFWQFPHLLAEFLVVADGVFSLYGLEHADELFISNVLFWQFPHLLTEFLVVADGVLIQSLWVGARR